MLLIIYSSKFGSFERDVAALKLITLLNMKAGTGHCRAKCKNLGRYFKFVFGLSMPCF